MKRNKKRAKRKEKEEHAMIVAWGSDSDDHEVDETAFMAFGDSDIEEENDAPEVSLLELKEKLHLFSKTRLVFLMSDLIDSLQELTSDRDELFNSLASLKFDFIDLKICKHSVEKENWTLTNQVTLLESSNNNLKSEVLILTLTENGKKAMSKEQEKAELELTKYKQECHNLIEKMNKLSQKVAKLKLDLERANRWTNSSRIVHQLSERNHNEKAGLGFLKKVDNLQDLCYICGNLGYPTIECPVVATSRIRSQNLVTNFSQTKIQVLKLVRETGQVMSFLHGLEEI